MITTPKQLLRPHALLLGDRLVRLGRNLDGGYLIPESVLVYCDSLYSFGIGDDYSFEKAWVEKFPYDNSVVMYDHTVNLFPDMPIQFVQEKCTPKLLYELEAPFKFVLKLDIEGDEYECLYPIDTWLNLPVGLIVEFHHLSKNEEKLRCILGKLMACGFKIVHLHGNNHAALTHEGLPDTIEVTFVQGPVGEPFTGSLSLPGLDFPNNPDAPDYVITFP